LNRFGDSFFHTECNVSQYKKYPSSISEFGPKTKPCPFLLSGKCIQEQNRTIAFNQQEARQNSILSKTKLCALYQMGYCSKGLSCTFAHGEHELVTPPNFFKTTLCIPFMNGLTCKFGSKCKFAHGQHELRRKPVSDVALPKQINSSTSLRKQNLISATAYSNGNASTNNFSKILMQFDSLQDRISKNSLLSLPGASESSSSALTGVPMTDLQDEALYRHEQRSLFNSFSQANECHSQSELEKMIQKASIANINQTKFREEFPY
jgi:hypothetical protein